MDAFKVSEILKEAGIRPTTQRIDVYKYLLENRTHPSADSIYCALSEQYPSFSRTTIYNSLLVLMSSGLVIPVNIDSTEVHYDSNTEYHGHFICSRCKKIIDIKIEKSEDDFPEISDCTVEQRDYYLHGLCADCNKLN